MIAFEIFWRPIYRYWIFYLISFVVGYIFLKRFPKSLYMQSNKQRFWSLHSLLVEKLDDVFLIIILWVIIWWRLGHVFFYERGYYSQHLIDILKINQWGMSFVWWITGVVIWLLYLFRKYKLSKKELLLFGDIVLLIVPLWSFLGRIWNYLNQELVWKPLDQIHTSLAYILDTLWLTHVFTNIDTVVRVNTNFIQSGLEGLLLLCMWWCLFIFCYKKDTTPGLIVWIYFIWYAIVRFWVEFLKDLPELEKYGYLSTSQILVILLFFTWLNLLRIRKALN